MISFTFILRQEVYLFCIDVDIVTIGESSVSDTLEIDFDPDIFNEFLHFLGKNNFRLEADVLEVNMDSWKSCHDLRRCFSYFICMQGS